jgi:hypothetical protein
MAADVLPLPNRNAKDQENAFLMGDSLLLHTALSADQRHISSYFPKANFYSLQRLIQITCYFSRQSASFLQLPASYTYINAHIKGGSIIAYQEALHTKALRTKDLLSLPTV